MFRKIRIGASDPDPPVAFDDSFWQWYYDSYSRHISQVEVEGLLKPLAKRFYSGSSAVQQVIEYFDLQKLPLPSITQTIALLKSPFTQGDPIKTFYLIRYFQVSGDGLFITNEGIDKAGNSISLVGAENWENVMCYLDALLFSMFANLESFEPMLFVSNQHDYLTNQLSALLRLYVNLLRSGNLITTDITMRICEVLKKLGFSEAMSHKQQDSATLFEFLTEVLAMPLLTFKIDIKHGGKIDKGDQKYSKERILFVSLPDDETITENQVAEEPGEEDDDHEDAILLEECLEHYFNNSISVKRELERRATLESLRASNAGEVVFEDIPEDPSELTDPSRSPKRIYRSDSKSNSVRLQTRTRSSTLSLWSNYNDSSDTDSNKPREVSLPAWMFLRLLPFYTDDNDEENTVKSSLEFVNRRPIVPICLKRYSFNSEKIVANRSQKRIIIPPIIDLPSFVADDINDSITGDYKLILESALCHRGTTISSGHFVSAIRKNTNNVNETDEEAHNATWYLYDDIKKKSRVREKTFKDIFDSEWPYMLFYRLVANGERSRTTSASSSHSSLFIPPKGSKSKYWSEKPEDTLSPILSMSSLPKSETSAVSSAVTIPIPEASPSEAKFLDVRMKYYWYFTDKNKNYYKELPTLSKSGTREMSVSLSPQFRRNSQWSNTSSMLPETTGNPPSTMGKSDLTEVDEKLRNLELSQTESRGSSKWKLPFSNRGSKSAVGSAVGSPDVVTPISISETNLHRTISPIDMSGKKEEKQHHLGEDEKEKQHHHLSGDPKEEGKKQHHHHFGGDQKKRKHKKLLKRRDDYRKEKCIIL